MQQGIHPDYHPVEVTCSCGNTFVTRTAGKEDHMFVDVCSQCHPFYTGTQKLVDTGGRVQRFADKFGGAAAAQLKKAQEAKAAKAAEAREKFNKAMDDDLNTPDALAAIFEFVKDINTMSDAADKATLEKAAATFDELTGVLGLMYNRKAEEAPDEVKQLVEERAAAKKAKDFARADALRAKITELGWNVMDTAKGPQLTKL